MFKKRPDVSICLLTWNRADFLEICLRKMFAALTPTEEGGLTREILIMDNCSTDGTADVLAKYENCGSSKFLVENLSSAV